MASQLPLEQVIQERMKREQGQTAIHYDLASDNIHHNYYIIPLVYKSTLCIVQGDYTRAWILVTEDHRRPSCRLPTITSLRLCEHTENASVVNLEDLKFWRNSFISENENYVSKEARMRTQTQVLWGKLSVMAHKMEVAGLRVAQITPPCGSVLTS